MFIILAPVIPKSKTKSENILSEINILHRKLILGAIHKLRRQARGRGLPNVYATT